MKYMLISLNLLCLWAWKSLVILQLAKPCNLIVEIYTFYVHIFSLVLVIYIYFTVVSMFILCIMNHGMIQHCFNWNPRRASINCSYNWREDVNRKHHFIPLVKTFPMHRIYRTSVTTVLCKIDGPQWDTISDAVRDEEPQFIDVGTPIVPIWMESLSMGGEHRKVIPSYLLVTRYTYTG